MDRRRGAQNERSFITDEWVVILRLVGVCAGSKRTVVSGGGRADGLRIGCA